VSCADELWGFAEESLARWHLFSTLETSKHVGHDDVPDGRDEPALTPQRGAQGPGEHSVFSLDTLHKIIEGIRQNAYEAIELTLTDSAGHT
jgi:hypothetical protein